MREKDVKVFGETNCLSEEALVEYAHGKLDIHLKKQVEIHINECDFCRDALKGVSLLKDKNSTRAAIASLNEKIANYGKPEPAAGKVILMNYWRMAAAIALFIVLGGGVVWLAVNPPFKNETAQKDANEKELAENNNKVEAPAQQLSDSMIGNGFAAMKTEDETIVMEIPAEEKTKEIVLQKKQEVPAAANGSTTKTIVEISDNTKEKDVEKVTATGGISNVAGDYYTYTNEVQQAPAPAVLRDDDAEGKTAAAKEDKLTGESEAAAFMQTKKSTKSDKENLKREEEVKSKAERKAKAASVSETAVADYDALKVSDERGDVERARKNLEEQAQLASETKKAEEASGEEEKVYAFVEEMPQYPGGVDALKKYIAQNIRYPENAREQNISGTVYISYVVNERGEVTRVKVWRGLNEFLDAEAVRVVSSVKGYTPGRQNGKPVSVQMTLPVRFSLE